MSGVVVEESGSEDISCEESVVCVEFCAAIDSQIFNNNLNSIKFLGLDTNQVMLQMSGNTFFCGQLENIFGTNVMFEVKDNNQKNETKSEKSLHYIGKCDQKLVVKRVFLESQQKQSTDSMDSVDKQTDNRHNT